MNARPVTLADLARQALEAANAPAVTLPPSSNEDSEPDPGHRRRWLIRHADGNVESHSFTPAATRTAVGCWYPDALSA